MKNILLKSAAFMNLGILISCAHQGAAGNSISLVAAQDVTVQVGDQEPKQQAAGASFSVDQPTLITSPGFYPMTIVPAETGRANLKIKLSPVETNDETRVNPQLEANQLLSDTIRVQSLIAKKKGSEALTLVEELQKKWDQVAVLDLLKASALIVDGNLRRAKTILEEALKKDPSNKDLKELLTRLSQRKI